MQALVSVAERFLVDIPDTDSELRGNIAQHMAFTHLSVAQASKEYGLAWLAWTGCLC